MALLVLALTVTVTKLKKVRAEKCHSDPPHCYNQTGGGKGKTKESIYAEVGEGRVPFEGQRGHYQDLNMATLESRLYATLHGEGHQC